MSVEPVEDGFGTLALDITTSGTCFAFTRVQFDDPDGVFSDPTNNIAAHVSSGGDCDPCTVTLIETSTKPKFPRNPEFPDNVPLGTWQVLDSWLNGALGPAIDGSPNSYVDGDDKELSCGEHAFVLISYSYTAYPEGEDPVSKTATATIDIYCSPCADEPPSDPWAGI